MTAWVWFRRDLRVQDNPALSSACASGRRVQAIYIHDPQAEGDWPAGAASRWYLHHSLSSLQAELAQLGIPLHLRRGATLHHLRKLADEGISALYWSRCEEPAWQELDQQVEVWLVKRRISAQAFVDNLFFAPGGIQRAAGKPYLVFTAFWKRARALLPEVMPQPEMMLPSAVALPVQQAGSVNQLGLLDAHPWHFKLAQYWQPGEQGALDSWYRFLHHGLTHYASGRDYPSQPNTSRLSPALHFGEISLTRIWRDLQPLLAGEQGAALAAAAEKFLSELGWREFARHTLHWLPQASDRSIDQRFEQAAAWRRNEQHLLLWQTGETGIPLVDAGMRELWQTGWMHNRVRMVVASFLTKNLGIHWCEGARWFWDCLVDADLANNSLSWQWVAGCGLDAAPYYRIFNPLLQAQKFDANGDYVHRWLGDELRAAPIVDLAESRKAALERYSAIVRSNNQVH